MDAKKVVDMKELGWSIAKTVCKGLGMVGAGIVIGAGLAGIDLGPLKGPAKLATGLGILGLADACGEVAGKQIEKRVDEAREVAGFGEKFAENLDELKKKKEAEAQAASA